jgi:protein MAK11
MAFPSRLILIAGTYDGVLAGWDTVSHARPSDAHDVDLKLLRRNDGMYLKMSFAMATHEGSVRCLDVASAPVASGTGGKKRPRSDSKDSSDAKSTDEPQHEPGALLSGGYDETIAIFNLQKHNQAGELKTPSDLGSPLCCSFAPPSSSSAAGPPTHALVGTTSGKIVLYKKRDWSVQHVLSGHDEQGVHTLAVHPSGRMALSGGRDGKLILWDLMKGRLAFVYKLPSLKKRNESVNHVVWSGDGNRYAFCYGNKITARDVSSGEDLLDVEMPSRVNQLVFIGGVEGMFLAAACDDGGLPVLEVGQLEEDGNANERRAIMAIEPVDRVVAGDDRLKCIKAVEGGSGFLVATANSGGVVSVMDLEGAARMMLTGSNDEGYGSDDESESENNYANDESDSDGEVEAAVEILDSVRIGSGARITNLAVWSHAGQDEGLDNNFEASSSESEVASSEEDEESVEERDIKPTKKTKGPEKSSNSKIELDAEAVKKARKLVGQAKKHQEKKKKKQASKSS